MSTSPMGANKPIEDIEATLLAATKSALLVRLRKISVLPLTVSNRCKKSSESGEMNVRYGVDCGS
jgi:hypothetical protein